MNNRPLKTILSYAKLKLNRRGSAQDGLGGGYSGGLILSEKFTINYHTAQISEEIPGVKYTT
jgi:hypothetical protein